MRPERQIELLQRVADAGPDLVGLHAQASMRNPASVYTDTQRFLAERQVLFRDGPVFFGMSADLPAPGSFRAMRIGGIPIMVVRQADGTLRALINVCRHRGASLVDTVSAGDGVRQFSCPYHACTYELDGKLRARPGSSGGFDDVVTDCSLHERAVAERYGLVFVRPQDQTPIDIDSVLDGAEDDLGGFGLEDYVHVESRTRDWNMNWKLIFDTFTESYHIRFLHRNSIAPMFNSNCTIFEPFGRNFASIGLRESVSEEINKPKEQWSLIPYGTMQYFLLPSGLVVHQLDHVEVWNVEPLSVDRTQVTTSIYAPTRPETDGQRGYWTKNLDLLLQVTGTEDFPLMEQIQANLSSGALAEVV